MAQEYRVLVTATFDNAKDRDKCAEDVKALFNSKKAVGDVIKKANLTKDDYDIPDLAVVTESL